jgi:hypothetical protein
MADEVLIFIVKNHVTLMLGGGGGGKDSRSNEGLSMRVRGVLI